MDLGLTTPHCYSFSSSSFRIIDTNVAVRGPYALDGTLLPALSSPFLVFDFTAFCMRMKLVFCIARRGIACLLRTTPNPARQAGKEPVLRGLRPMILASY